MLEADCSMAVNVSNFKALEPLWLGSDCEGVLVLVRQTTKGFKAAKGDEHHQDFQEFAPEETPPGRERNQLFESDSDGWVEHASPLCT